MSQHCLIVVDVQNDFCPGGALAVPGGDEIVPHVNSLISEFDHVVLTQDWHPSGHASFASLYPGRKPFDTIELNYGTQVLWPDHCVQGSHGAAFHADLRTDKAELIVRKGFRHGMDSYSAFFENDRETPTGLAGYLRERGIISVTLCGLAFDYCVGFSALDAASAGFATAVIAHACRAIDDHGSAVHMRAGLVDAGVELV
ncbi:MAG: bifunctional nicotinamidase/pyrazinamidase [Alphaproteobacteria bacterium]|nr:bifunctional nicotinamidase/pyrazinamidase [Alphaproteobacteria bacterium]